MRSVDVFLVRTCPIPHTRMTIVQRNNPTPVASPFWNSAMIGMQKLPITKCEYTLSLFHFDGSIDLIRSVPFQAWEKVQRRPFDCRSKQPILVFSPFSNIQSFISGRKGLLGVTN